MLNTMDGEEAVGVEDAMGAMAGATRIIQAITLLFSMDIVL